MKVSEREIGDLNLHATLRGLRWSQKDRRDVLYNTNNLVSVRGKANRQMIKKQVTAAINQKVIEKEKVDT